MENNNNQYLLVFISNNYAVMVFNKLVKKGLSVELISTPCTISAGCSQSIRFEEKYLEKMKEELKLNRICIKGIYKIRKEEGKEDYILVIKS